ncbi:hypothetical protein [Providencia stuartii]|uniref:hypothetical protein n=1 Tax=Providencia stuartii TaxID=588 RepID=UPI0018C61A44|nr:hypothetical protein [Providencia stuartii]MBG5920944.1 hypothetical protein [Providencia stuartii]
MVQSITHKALNYTQQLQQPQTTAHNSGITGNIKRTTNNVQSNPVLNQQNTSKVDSGIFKLKELKGIEKEVNSIQQKMKTLLENIGHERGAMERENNKKELTIFSNTLHSLKAKTANYQERLNSVNYKQNSKKRETLAKFESKLNAASLDKNKIESKEGYKNTKATQEANKKFDNTTPKYVTPRSLL